MPGYALTTDYEDLWSRWIYCRSTHLSQFAVLYTPFDPSSVYNLPEFSSLKNLTEPIIEATALEESPLMMYLIPAIFAVVVLILAVLGLVMNQLDNQHRDRFYNKNSFNENLQKYTFCRLLGCLILQFNPLFNYVFKTNLYLGRPLRLLIFINYFLMISGASLVYFTVEVQS